MARVTALTFAIFLALFEIGSCVRCRQCNSQSNAKCADPYADTTSPSVDCQSQDSINYNKIYLERLLQPSVIEHVTGNLQRYCHKIITETGTVIRACLDTNSVNVNSTCQLLDSRSGTGQKIKHCSVCVKDDCNGASAAVASLPLALTLLASYLYFK